MQNPVKEYLSVWLLPDINYVYFGSYNQPREADQRQPRQQLHQDVYLPLQAQLRVHECSQKLELLRLSLERCLKESSQESLQPPAGRTDGSEEPPSPHSSTSRCPLSTSPSLLSIRPASLTGVHHLQFYSDNKTYHFSKGLWMKKHIERGSLGPWWL